MGDAYNAHFTATGTRCFPGAGRRRQSCGHRCALASNTALNSGVVPLFADWRLKWNSVGTWVAGTLVAYAMPRG
jgi:hypothetical protein